MTLTVTDLRKRVLEGLPITLEEEALLLQTIRRGYTAVPAVKAKKTPTAGKAKPVGGVHAGKGLDDLLSGL